MDENPYQPPTTPLVGEPRPTTRASRRVRLTVFLGHCLLVLLFPPHCCPCGFGMIGIVFQLYFAVLVLPALVLGWLIPDLVHGNMPAFSALVIANFVVAAYLVGEVAGRLAKRSDLPAMTASKASQLPKPSESHIPGQGQIPHPPPFL